MNDRHLLCLEARMSEPGKSPWTQHNCHFMELKAERCNLVRNLFIVIHFYPFLWKIKRIPQIIFLTKVAFDTPQLILVSSITPKSHDLINSLSLLVSTGLLKVLSSQHPICCKSSKLAQDMETGNKSFIMLDRWNKPSHDSSNSTIGIFTHTGYM